jgi:hypothetical protein
MLASKMNNLTKNINNNSEKSNGPSTEPWGTPEITARNSWNHSLKFTFNFIDGLPALLHFTQASSIL